MPIPNWIAARDRAFTQLVAGEMTSAHLGKTIAQFALPACLAGLGLLTDEKSALFGSLIIAPLGAHLLTIGSAVSGAHLGPLELDPRVVRGALPSDQSTSRQSLFESVTRDKIKGSHYATVTNSLFRTLIPVTQNVPVDTEDMSEQDLINYHGIYGDSLQERLVTLKDMYDRETNPSRKNDLARIFRMNAAMQIHTHASKAGTRSQDKCLFAPNINSREYNTSTVDGRMALYDQLNVANLKPIPRNGTMGNAPSAIITGVAVFNFVVQSLGIILVGFILGLWLGRHETNELLKRTNDWYRTWNDFFGNILIGLIVGMMAMSLMMRRGGDSMTVGMALAILPALTACGIKLGMAAMQARTDRIVVSRAGCPAPSPEEAENVGGAPNPCDPIKGATKYHLAGAMSAGMLALINAALLVLGMWIVAKLRKRFMDNSGSRHVVIGGGLLFVVLAVVIPLVAPKATPRSVLSAGPFGMVENLLPK